MSDIAKAVTEIVRWLPLLPTMIDLFGTPTQARKALRAWELEQRRARDARIAKQRTP